MTFTLKLCWAFIGYTVSVGRKEVTLLDFDFAIKGPQLWNRADFQEETADVYLFKRQYYSID